MLSTLRLTAPPAFLGLVAFLATPDTAAQDCDAILRHGIRNVQISKSTEASIATKYFNTCSHNFSSMTDEVLGRAEVEVFGLGGGGGSYSRAQREQRLADWCQTNHDTAQTYKDQYEESQTIYGSAVAAWDSCNKIKSEGVQIDPQISPDAKTVDIRLKYTGSAPTGVQLVGVKQEAFACSIEVPTKKGITKFDPSTPTMITNQAINIHCLRAVASSITRDGTTYSVVPRGTISIQTAGQGMQLFFVEEWDPGLPAKQAELFRKQIASLQATLAQLPATQKRLDDLAIAVGAAQSRLDTEAQATRFVLSNTCPAGWDDLGYAGIIINNTVIPRSPFAGGAGFNGEWTWTHPRLCQRK